FRYVAHEIRELLASLGLRSLEEAVGRTDLLRQRTTGVAEADALRLHKLLALPANFAQQEIRHAGERNPLPVGETLNDRLLQDAQPALEGRGSVELNYTIRNCERTVGARLSGVIGQMYGDHGLPSDTIRINLRGSAGQSFGAFNAPGVSFHLIGEANDYVGKGMAGGTIAIHPSREAAYAWHENVIAGNTILYGATGGELYLAGRVGERFAVRNSGATVVVEGVGDHGCEYMTGGTAVILGSTGYNFGAGMTGGVAFVLDVEERLPIRYNRQLVQLDRLNQQDQERLRELVQRHADLTGSPRAAEILANWAAYVPLFWRVMPREMVARIEAQNAGTRGGRHGDL
ncbi:MAG: glutamate synthase subunit alpha, partial [Chloroflexaceae bacterium]|nr:glutamate synthase subunit alpha [Chloroflexaceae bacterium]